MSNDTDFALIFEDDEMIKPGFLGRLKAVLERSMTLPAFDYFNLNTLRPWPHMLVEGEGEHPAIYKYHQKGDQEAVQVPEEYKRSCPWCLISVWSGLVLIRTSSAAKLGGLMMESRWDWNSC